MATYIDIVEAEAQLDDLVDAALRNEEIVITVAGQPQVRLVPVAAADKATSEAQE